MLFNSYTFWIFYGCLFAIYHRLQRRNQNIVLLIGSYVFYGCWDWRFLGLIALSTIVDYCVALAIAGSTEQRRRKLLLAVSICANLGILLFFKYYGFFAGELEVLLTNIGVPAMLPTLNIVLPVGISFYTFQTMSYTIDVYRGDCKETRSILDFAVYVSFFPQLVAGPIERASHFLPQVQKTRVHTSTDFRDGLFLILSGLFRKVVIADNMAPLANVIFSTSAADLSGAEILLGVYAFAFQIYGDFSGYSQIARGTAKWLGFDLMVNFARPYFAVSASDFWRRWHISLSQWLRDYLYIPLGGSRGGEWKTHRNLTLTMLLGGLWHGAAWTFVVWGLFHGILQAIFKLVQGPGKPKPLSLPHRCVMIVFMFHLTCFGWLLFRAESMSQVVAFSTQMATHFSMTPMAWTMLGLIAFYVIPLLAFECWCEVKKVHAPVFQVHWAWRGTAYLYVVAMIVFFPPPMPSQFIYFQF